MQGVGTIAAALLASVALPAAALAQAVPADTAPKLDEIVVTAQKRSENLQNVPISIQVLGTKKLDQLDVANFNDFSKFLPSVTFQSVQPGETTVYIRGVASGGDGNHSGPLPSVGVYLDEQPVTTIGGTLDIHIYDIARIEALAGPQGTLYGASSEAGTIRIITNKPEIGVLSGAIDGEVNTVAHGEVGGKLESFLNLPVNDHIAARIVGWYQRNAGFIDNVPGTRTFLPASDGTQIVKNNRAYVASNYNDVNIVGGRAALKIDLDDRWTVEPTVFGQSEINHGSFGFDPLVGDLEVQHFAPEYYRDRFVQAALTVTGKVGSLDLTYAGAYLDRVVHSSADYTDYAEQYDSLYAGAGGIAQYFYFTDNAGHHIDPSQRIVGADHFTKLSQELRIATPAANRIRFVGGLFYQLQTRLIHQDYQVPGLADNLSVNGHPGTLWLTQQDRTDRDYAVFGEASWDILPTVTLTGGGRVFKYDNSLIGFFGFGRDPNGPPYNAAGSSRTGVAGCYTADGSLVRDGTGAAELPAAVPGGPCTNLADYVNGRLVPKDANDVGTTYKFNATWKIDPDHLVYGTISRGFRPGGINRRAGLEPYASDFLQNYEIGFKTSWLNRALKINGAFFWQEWEKFQFAFLGANSFTEIHNGPNARIRGIEADVNWTIVPGLTLVGAGTYTDAVTRRNLCGFDDPNPACTTPSPQGVANFIAAPAGTRLPVTPQIKLNGTLRYEAALADQLKGHVQGVVVYASSASSDIRTAALTPPVPSSPDGAEVFYNPAAGLGRLRAYTTFDFAAGLNWPFLSAEIVIENAFDTRAELSRYQECGSCFQRPYVVVNMPRTIGLRLGHSF
ncbi:MAG: TonB-dependent receptor [Sphingomonadaceae bacterium]|nr:TonB-dependent receptor [Sphingomonadaceae bacterium]